jgi:hypothetical protein
MIIRSEPTRRIDLFIAGDINTARQTCRRFCLTGFCVTITPTEFIYTYGAEQGVRIGIINYPKFSLSWDELWLKAEALSSVLLDDLCQGALCMVGDEKTIWVTRHTQDQV